MEEKDQDQSLNATVNRPLLLQDKEDEPIDFRPKRVGQDTMIQPGDSILGDDSLNLLVDENAIDNSVQEYLNSKGKKVGVSEKLGEVELYGTTGDIILQDKNVPVVHQNAPSADFSTIQVRVNPFVGNPYKDNQGQTLKNSERSQMSVTEECHTLDREKDGRPTKKVVRIEHLNQ